MIARVFFQFDADSSAQRARMTALAIAALPGVNVGRPFFLAAIDADAVAPYGLTVWADAVSADGAADLIEAIKAAVTGAAAAVGARIARISPEIG